MSYLYKTFINKNSILQSRIIINLPRPQDKEVLKCVASLSNKNKTKTMLMLMLMLTLTLTCVDVPQEPCRET